MDKTLSLILCFLPPFFSNFIRKRMGAEIARSAKISFGALVVASKIRLGEEAKVKPFSVVIATEFSLGDKSVIKSFSLIRTKIVDIKKYVVIRSFAVINSGISEKSIIRIGDHSSIFPFCWLEPTEGIFIGKQVGIGGHNLIFTHGSWSNYLKGGPVQFGSVTIEDNVWLPWRVFIMPGVTIGNGSIISANSLVNKSIPANSFAGGSPAKVIKEDFIQEPNAENKKKRMERIIRSFFERTQLNSSDYPDFVIDNLQSVQPDCIFVDLNLGLSKEKCNALSKKGAGIYSYPLNTFFLPTNSIKMNEMNRFSSFISIYGIRPYIEYV